MKIILDELSPREFFSNGGVVKITIESSFIKELYRKRTKFLFYEYKAYIRFMREIYIRYMRKYPDLKSQEVYKQVNEGICVKCNIGTKEYVTDPSFDGVTSLEFSNFYYCYDTDFYERNRKSGRIDPYGVKNVNFSLIDPDDDRWDEFEEQRLKRGFDDSELWNLYYTIAGFILPRLKAFREETVSYPAGMTREQWESILDEMIVAFELIYEDKCDSESNKKIEQGIKTFAKYFRGLWN